MPHPPQHTELAPRPTSAAAARRFLQRALADGAPRAQEIGVLLGSELVTNALLYAPGTIELRVDQGAGRRVRVTVRDGSSHAVEPKHGGVEATSGRGLAIVDALADDWGVHLVEDGGKEVWFELDG